MKVINKKLVLFFLILSIVYGCKQRKNHDLSANSKNTSITLNYKIDTLLLELPVSSGTFLVKSDSSSIYVLDYRFSTLSVFDSSGKFIDRQLGLGKGPNEIPFLVYKFCLKGKGDKILVGDIHIGRYNKNHKLNIKRINWDVKENKHQLLKNPSGDMNGIYEIDWSKGENRIAANDSLVFLPIVTYHPLFNGYQHSRYYKEAKVVGAFRLSDGKLRNKFGLRPNVYLEKKFIPNFDVAYLASGNGLVFISFAADSSIHAYTTNGDFRFRFGASEKEIKNNYPIYNSIDDCDKNIFSNRREYGYYKDVVYSETDSILARQVYLGGDSKYSVLQVYKNEKIIKRIKLPINFKLASVSAGKIIGFTNEDNYTSDTLKLFVIRYKLITKQ